VEAVNEKLHDEDQQKNRGHLKEAGGFTRWP
jgi:hypothetical protein